MLECVPLARHLVPWTKFKLFDKLTEQGQPKYLPQKYMHVVQRMLFYYLQLLQQPLETTNQRANGSGLLVWSSHTWPARVQRMDFGVFGVKQKHLQ